MQIEGLVFDKMSGVKRAELFCNSVKLFFVFDFNENKITGNYKSLYIQADLPKCLQKPKSIKKIAVTLFHNTIQATCW